MSSNAKTKIKLSLALETTTGRQPWVSSRGLLAISTPSFHTPHVHQRSNLARVVGRSFAEAKPAKNLGGGPRPQNSSLQPLKTVRGIRDLERKKSTLKTLKGSKEHLFPKASTGKNQEKIMTGGEQT